MRTGAEHTKHQTFKDRRDESYGDWGTRGGGVPEVISEKENARRKKTRSLLSDFRYDISLSEPPYPHRQTATTWNCDICQYQTQNDCGRCNVCHKFEGPPQNVQTDVGNNVTCSGLSAFYTGPLHNLQAQGRETDDEDEDEDEDEDNLAILRRWHELRPHEPSMARRRGALFHKKKKQAKP